MSKGIKTGLWQEYQSEETRRMQEKLNRRNYQHYRDGAINTEKRHRAKTKSMLRTVYAVKGLGKVLFYVAISLFGSIDLTVLLNPPIRELIAEYIKNIFK